MAALPEVFILDHLVGGNEHGIWEIKSELICGLQIYYQLVLGRHLYWKIGWRFTPQDAVDVCCCFNIQVREVDAVGNQAPARN